MGSALALQGSVQLFISVHTRNKREKRSQRLVCCTGVSVWRSYLLNNGRVADRSATPPSQTWLTVVRHCRPIHVWGWSAGWRVGSLHGLHVLRGLLGYIVCVEVQRDSATN